MPKKFSGWSHSLYPLTFPFHFVRFLFRFTFLTSHIASWTETESDRDGASFKPRFSFPSFPAIQTHLSCRCGSNHFFADFFPSSVTITITTITTTLTSFLDHSDEDSYCFHFTILKSLFSRKSKLQRPMNGFMLFAKKFRLELIQQHPGKDNRWGYL